MLLKPRPRLHFEMNLVEILMPKADFKFFGAKLKESVMLRSPVVNEAESLDTGFVG